jgi:phosphatidylglycerophosphate synthase
MTWAELRIKCKRQSDYIITMFVTNELSLILTWILIKTRLTPNQVTVASIICGFGCALCYAFGKFLIGSILLFFSHVLDCTDGNLARAKSNFSTTGKYLDMFGDRICEACLLAGVAVYFHSSETTDYWVILSLANAILLLLYYYSVDISLALGLSKPVQRLSKMKYKGVQLKWGLLEPFLYGFIVLAPLDLLPLQLVIIGVLTLAGLAYQAGKLIYAAKNQPG